MVKNELYQLDFNSQSNQKLFVSTISVSTFICLFIIVICVFSKPPTITHFSLYFTYFTNLINHDQYNFSLLLTLTSPNQLRLKKLLDTNNKKTILLYFVKLQHKSIAFLASLDQAIKVKQDVWGNGMPAIILQRIIYNWYTTYTSFQRVQSIVL